MSIAIESTTTRRAGTTAQSTGTWRVAAVLGAVLFLTMLPVTMIVPVLKELLMDRFAASTFTAHLFMSLNLLGGIAALPVLAVLSDRRGRRKPIVAIALLLDALLLAAMAWLPSLPLMLAARFFEGAAHMLALTTLMALAADWAGDRKRGRMMGIVGASMMFGTACGTRLGGLAWRAWPGHLFELAAAVAVLAAVVTAITLQDAATRRPASKMRDALHLLVHDRKLLVPYAYAFIDRFCVGIVISTFVLYLATVLEMTPDQRSKLLVLFLLPFALLVYPAGRLCDRIGRVWPLAAGSMGFGLVFMSYGFLPATALPWAMLASGVLSAIMFAPNLTICADLAPQDRRGGAYAGFNAAGSLGFLCGPLLGGLLTTLLAEIWPLTTVYTITFVVAGSTELLCAAVTLPYLLALRRAGQTT